MVVERIGVITMEKAIFLVGSVTNAMRGKALLEQQGMTAQVQRVLHGQDQNGCGYRLLVSGDSERAMTILERAGLRVKCW